MHSKYLLILLLILIFPISSTANSSFGVKSGDSYTWAVSAEISDGTGVKDFTLKETIKISSFSQSGFNFSRSVEFINGNRSFFDAILKENYLNNYYGNSNSTNERFWPVEQTYWDSVKNSISSQRSNSSVTLISHNFFKYLGSYQWYITKIDETGSSRTRTEISYKVDSKTGVLLYKYYKTGELTVGTNTEYNYFFQTTVRLLSIKNLITNLQVPYYLVAFIAILFILYKLFMRQVNPKIDVKNINNEEPEINSDKNKK